MWNVLSLLCTSKGSSLGASGLCPQDEGSVVYKCCQAPPGEVGRLPAAALSKCFLYYFVNLCVLLH